MVTEKTEGGYEVACNRDPKWAALVDDIVVPLPQQHVRSRLIKSQAGSSPERVLVRDHNSPDDVVLSDEQTVDLAAGNVFYTLSPCDLTSRGECQAPAKLAFFVDDRAEVTTQVSQTGQSIRDLFCLPPNSRLVRDYEGGTDLDVLLTDIVKFAEGSVFYTRPIVSNLHITVNARGFAEADGVKSTMTGKEIAALVYPDNPTQTTVWFLSDGNREVGMDESLHIRGCEVFDVARKNVDGGFEPDRVQRELDELRRTGQEVTLVQHPQPAVIYRGLRTRPGYGVATTDVLVPVPGGYPGQFLDWAYLPEDSSLIGKVKGSPQDHRMIADGRTWRQVSYHPHVNGGGPPWNPARHGFHTYMGELLSWLYDAS